MADRSVAKCVSYDNTDVSFHNMQDSAIIISCVTSLANVRKSNRNFVVALTCAMVSKF